MSNKIQEICRRGRLQGNKMATFVYLFCLGVARTKSSLAFYDFEKLARGDHLYPLISFEVE
jgi:hypothetical protein